MIRKLRSTSQIASRRNSRNCYGIKLKDSGIHSTRQKYVTALVYKSEHQCFDHYERQKRCYATSSKTESRFQPQHNNLLDLLAMPHKTDQGITTRSMTSYAANVESNEGDYSQGNLSMKGTQRNTTDIDMKHNFQQEVKAILSMNIDTNDDENDNNVDNWQDLVTLADKLKSYSSLQMALVDRDEGGDVSSHEPRFSQFLLKDVLKIVRTFDTTSHDPLLNPRELLSILNNLVLPRNEMTIPSHALKALLELKILSLRHLNPKGTNAFSSSINCETSLSLDDVVLCQELLQRMSSVQIYYTREDQNHHYQDWNKSLLVILNHILNLYGVLAANLKDLDASRDVVQMAELLLTKSASSSEQFYQRRQGITETCPEQLQLLPDVISFNSVMTAWGKSVQKSHFKNKRRQFNAKAVHAASIAAAERAQTILMLLLDLSVHDSELTPTETSYNAVLGAWANASLSNPERASSEAMALLKEMVERYYENPSSNPPPTAATLVTISKVLCSCPTNHVHSNISKLIKFRNEFRIDSADIILNNALLTAYARSARLTSSVRGNLSVCWHMVDFFDTHIVQPDRVSFLMSLDALRHCARSIILNSREPDHLAALHDFVMPTSLRLLQHANEAGVADTRMHNDVLGTHACNVQEAERLFEIHPKADYMAYAHLLDAYEQSAKILSSSRNEEKIVTVQDLAERAEALLFKLEELSESTPSLRPHTNLYNAVILTHLERQSLAGVESAALVLQHLQAKYRRRLHEYQKNARVTRIAERPNTTSFLSVMSGYLKHSESAKNISLMENLWTTMTDLQLAKSQAPPVLSKKMAPVQANCIAMNTLLRMYAKYCHEFPSFLDQADHLVLERISPEPDEYSFTILFQAYANIVVNSRNTKDHSIGSKRRDILKRSKKLLKVVSDHIKRPSIRLYNSALHTLSQCCSEEAALIAEQILNQKMSTMQRDRYSYAAVISAWTNLNTKEGVAQAEKILLSPDAEGVVDAFCFNTVLRGYAKFGALDQMESLAEKMEARGIKPTAFTHQTFAISSTSNNSISPHNYEHDENVSKQYYVYDKLQQLLNQYEATKSLNDKPAPRMFTHVISKLFHVEGSEDKMLSVLEQKLKFAECDNNLEDYLPNKFEVDSVLKRLAATGKIDETMSIISCLQDRGVQISTKAYNAIIAACAIAAKERKVEGVELAEKAMTLLNQMEHANAKAYADCIAAWVHCGQNSSHHTKKLSYDKEAESVLNLMTTKRLEESITFEKNDLARAYHMALKACLMKSTYNEAGDNDLSVQRGARIFAEMIRQDLTSPSSYAYMLHMSKYIKPKSKQKIVCIKLIEQCQASGQFSSSVLETLRSIFSETQLTKLLQMPSKNMISFQDLPPRWSSNVSNVRLH